MSVVINGTTGITNDGGYTGDGVVFADTTPANTLVTTTGGNVGVGTNAPVYKLDAVTSALGNTAGNQQLIYRGTTNTGNNDAYEVLYDRTSSVSGWTSADVIIRRNVDSSGGQSQIRFGSGNYTSFWTNGAERARIDSNGNFLVGTTSTVVGGGGHRAIIAFAGGLNQYGLGFRPAADNTVTVTFSNAANALIGSIYTTGSTTAYNTSSDYRLKENVQPMTGALSLVQQLKPCTYKWKSDGSDGQGFIAHELQAVVPDCVTGEKDAVDAEGNPVYQGIDTSFLVATLTAAIQEQQAIILAQQAALTALTARVAALEGTQP